MTTNVANNLNIADRMGKIHIKNAYILFKDHKPNFSNNTQTRLINPTKSELGLISRNIIGKMTDQLSKATRANLWKDSSDTIKWFNSISDKKKATFIKFDSVDFYSSISRGLLID